MTDETTPSRSDRARLAIVQSAYVLFASQGYAATSMRQIARGAGLALGGIYNHFDSKDDIFKTIIAERHPFIQIIPLLKDIQGNSMDEFIRNAARRLVAELEQHPEFLNLMLIELVEFKGQHAPVLFETIFPDIMLVAGRLAAFQAELRPIPPLLLMRAFIGMFFAYFITDLLLKGLLPPDLHDNSFDGFVDIFLHGIRQTAQIPSTEPAS